MYALGLLALLSSLVAVHAGPTQNGDGTPNGQIQGSVILKAPAWSSVRKTWEEHHPGSASHEHKPSHTSHPPSPSDGNGRHKAPLFGGLGEDQWTIHFARDKHTEGYTHKDFTFTLYKHDGDWTQIQADAKAKKKPTLPPVDQQVNVSYIACIDGSRMLTPSSAPSFRRKTLPPKSKSVSRTPLLGSTSLPPLTVWMSSVPRLGGLKVCSLPDYQLLRRSAVQ
jgi:hypothetical protein